MNTLYDGLSEVLRNLLRSTDTRENVLEYLAEVINLNASRAHIQVNFFLLHLNNKT
jgi:ubiquitin conjugation factor E4 B